MNPTVDHGESSYQGSGQLQGLPALVTGADSGIGRAVAIAFARKGADVAISYLSEHQDAKETERLVTEAGRKAVLIPGDIGERSVTKLAVISSLTNRKLSAAPNPDAPT
ncbi:MAG: SDR family NAD(P)-dependent oxidoreductase [Chthoniobacterales bacterium]